MAPAKRLRMNIRRTAGSLGVTLTFFTAAARAADAPAPSTRDAIDAQLEAGIEEAADQAHASRTATAIAGAAGAAVLLPAGIALTQRSDAVSQSVGTGLAVNGGVSLLKSKYIPASVCAAIQNARQQILSGKIAIKVTHNAGQVQALLK